MKDKLAIIGYLLMSVDSDDDENRLQKLENFADAETLKTIATECEADCRDELADKAIECVDVALSGIADALESFARRLG